MEGQDRCAAAIAAKSTDPPVAAVIAAKVAAGSGRRDEAWPALKAAAADPAGTFTAAAAEAGDEDDDEGLEGRHRAAAANVHELCFQEAGRRGGCNLGVGARVRRGRGRRRPQGVHKLLRRRLRTGDELPGKSEGSTKAQLRGGNVGVLLWSGAQPKQDPREVGGPVMPAARARRASFSWR